MFFDNEYMRCPELPNPAYQVQGAAGGLVRGKPMICGGFYDNLFTYQTRGLDILLILLMGGHENTK